MKHLPLAPKPKPRVHSRLLPAWNDDFDLRKYFACIHPDGYEFRDDREHPLACQLFGAVQFMVLNRVQLYRALFLAYQHNPKVLKPAVLCVRSAFTRETGEHLGWFESPQMEFGGTSPQAWFRNLGFAELGTWLSFRPLTNKGDAFVGVPLQFRPESQPGVQHFQRAFKVDGRSLTGNQRHLLEELKSCFSEDQWDDEFDLAPYFACWNPVNLLPEKPSNELQLLGEVYQLMRIDFSGCIRIYRSALEVACIRGGAMEAVIRLDSGDLAYQPKRPLHLHAS